MAYVQETLKDYNFIVDTRPRNGEPLGLHLTTRRGNAPTCMGPVGGPSRCWRVMGLREVSGALSLSMEEGRSTFGSVTRLLAKF